jgi:hypothetical protein
MLGCFDQHHQATGAGLNCIRQRYERHSQCVNVSDHTRLDHRRREFRRLSLYCDNSSERHAELLTRRIATVKPPSSGGFSVSTPTGSHALVPTLLPAGVKFFEIDLEGADNHIYRCSKFASIAEKRRQSAYWHD